MHVSLDTIADTIALTSSEKSRLAELESVIETHLPTFLAVGRALAEIRAKRLFRQRFATFEDYCRGRWGFSGAHGLDLLRSASVAENLLSGPAAPDGGDAPLPLDLSPDTLRPLQRLDAPLQSAVWRLASKLGKPTAHVVAKVVRVVESAINESPNGNRASNPRTTLSPSEKKVFLASLHRLSESRIPVCVIVQGVSEEKAQRHLRAAQQLMSRLHELIGEIRQRFPSL